MKPTSVGAAVLAALLIGAPGAATAQTNTPQNSCDPVDIFCGLPDLSTVDGWKAAYRQLRGQPAPAPSAAQNAPMVKAGQNDDVEETPEERAAYLASSAAARAAAMRQADVEKARRESIYIKELAEIQVEDASALRFLSTDCASNDKPSGDCMNDVSRARKLGPRMQAFLANREVTEMLARMQITWRPESPVRAAAVKLPLEPGTETKAARAYLKVNSLRNADGGFLGCEARRRAVVEQGEPAQAETADTDVRNLWDADDAILSLAAIERSGQADSALNAYRTCVLRARWAELRLQAKNPSPTLQAALVTGAKTGDPFAETLFNQSASQAQVNPQAAAAALQAQQASRANELDDLTQRGKARADAIMSAALVGITTYAASIQSVNATPTVSYAPPAASAPAQAAGAPVRVAQAQPAPAPAPAPVSTDATGCVKVVTAQSVGLNPRQYDWALANSCAFRVDVVWSGGQAFLDPHGISPLGARPTSALTLTRMGH